MKYYSVSFSKFFLTVAVVNKNNFLTFERYERLFNPRGQRNYFKTMGLQLATLEKTLLDNFEKFCFSAPSLMISSLV